MALRWVCALLFITGGFAGCIEAESGTDDTDEQHEAVEPVARPDQIPWGMTGCDAAIILFDVAAENVQPHLPEGFVPVPVAMGVNGLAVNPTDGGSFGIEVFTCESGVGLNETVPTIGYGSYFAFVEPPAALKHSDVDYHFVKWDTLVPDEARRTFLQDLGAPAWNGSASFGSFTLDGSVGSLEGSLNMSVDHAISGSTYAPGPAAASFVEYMEVPGGLVAWKTAIVARDLGLGPGTAVIPQGTLAAEVLGSGSKDGVLMAFHGDFVDGTIMLPPTK